MKIDFDEDVRPYFQVLVTKVAQPVTAQVFFKKLKAVVAEKKNHAKRHLVEILQPATYAEVLEENFLAILLKHLQVPTWFKKENGVRLNEGKNGMPLDVEHDVLAFYKTGNYVFVYTNCEQILSIVLEVQDQLFEEKGIKFKKLSGDQLNHILGQFKIEYRSLGLRNHFGLGGTAPEGKTYYGRDTSASLTPSFDAGYGFSYCIGARIEDDGKQKPFGCSKNKSQLWTTWVTDLNELCTQCDLIVKWLESPRKENDQLDVLVQSTSKDVLAKVSPIEFFLDYYVMERGLVFIGNNEGLSLNWSCKYDFVRKAIHFMTMMEGGEIKESYVTLSYNTKEEKYDFAYMVGEEELVVAVAEVESGINTRNSFDIVEFLNKQEHFTILHDEPYAYRNEECYVDNRLKRPFLHYSVDIDWSDVEIKKENLPASVGKKNILQKIEEYFAADPNVIFSCNDNGANEIADYIVLYEDRLLLIHAKYATNEYPSVVIGDIQVVASQAVKNSRFFIRDAYSDTILQRLYDNATNDYGFADVEVFKKKFLEIAGSKDTRKECWIVQPGISVPKLKRDKTNKMHTLLNFVDSILKVNGISFQLVANPQEVVKPVAVATKKKVAQKKKAALVKKKARPPKKSSKP